MLEFGKRTLGRFKLFAQKFCLLLEPDGGLARRFDFQIEVDVNVGLREGVGEGRGKARLAAAVADVDDIALARGFHVELGLQQFGQPDNKLALAFGGFLPLRLDGRAFVHAQQLDHALGNAIAFDDVDLGGHVAGRDHSGHHAGNRVRLDVDQDGGAGGVLLGQEQADHQCDEYDGNQGVERRLGTRHQDEQELLEGHVWLLLENAFANVNHVVG